MKRFFFAIGIICLATNAQAWGPQTSIPQELACIFNSAVNFSTDTAQIDSRLSQYRQNMAAKDQIYNSGCIQEPGVPNRQLVYSGECGQYVYIHYFQSSFGGPVAYLDVYAQKSEGLVQVARYQINGETSYDPEAMRRAIENNHYISTKF